MKKKLAIFDIDGTIFRSALFVELVNGLVDDGVLPKRVLEDVEDEYMAWIKRKGNYKNYAYKLVDIFRREIKGKREKDVNRVSKKVMKEEREKVYKFGRDMINNLRKEGFYLLAVSGSPTPAVKEFADYYKFDKYFSTVYLVENGKYTGEAEGVRMDKIKILEEFLEQNNEVTLKGSVAIGDTEADIGVLEMVENPIAFNPNTELAEHARKKGWRIVVERKDVIYDIKDFRMING